MVDNARAGPTDASHHHESCAATHYRNCPVIHLLLKNIAINQISMALNLAIDRAQSSRVLFATSTTLHVAALVAVISHCLMPRGKFVKIMFFNVLALCIAFSVSCLALVCLVKA